MKVGKLSSRLLQELVLNKVGFRRSDVLVHAGLGEDCAVIDFGAEVCVLSTDPITGAYAGAGRLAVHVACNDIAASGAEPIGVQVLLLVPETAKHEQISKIMAEIAQEAELLGVEVLGGHTEVTSRISDLIVSLTAVGRAAKDQYVTSAGARPGDSVVLTKTAGIEGSLVLAQDYRQRLPFVTDDAVEQLRFMLSVIPEGKAAAEFGVHAMHDVTEAGLIGAAVEIAAASKVGIVLRRETVPVLSVTEKICSTLALDPLRLLGSGAMLITTDKPQGLVKHLNDGGVAAAIVGHVVVGSGVRVVAAAGEEEHYQDGVEDDLWRFFQDQES